MILTTLGILRRIFAGLAASVTLVATAVAEERRLALILANEDYPASIGRLTQARTDAQTVGDALREIGFTVITKLDQNSAETQSVISDFLSTVDSEASDGHDVVVFFYAAMHGVVADTIDGPRNFLVPAREQISSLVELLNLGVRVDAVINGLAMTQAKAIIVVSDACRNTPTAFSRSGVRGFVPIAAGPNMMIAYATEAGGTTPDDGVFARVLARELIASGRKANYAMADVVGSVGRERAINSRPYTTGSLPDWFCFNGCSSSVSPTVTVNSGVPLPPPATFDLAGLHDHVSRAVAEARMARTASESNDASACNTDNISDSNSRPGAAALGIGALFASNRNNGSRCQGGRVSPPPRGAFIGILNDVNSSYFGNFLNGKPDGPGVSLNLASGERYEGQWKLGKRAGLGVLWNRDGQVVSVGRWENDRLVEILLP